MIGQGSSGKVYRAQRRSDQCKASWAGMKNQKTHVFLGQMYYPYHHTIYVWHIYLHLADIYGKCR